MKTEKPRFFARVWRVLSDVPGWPDAPLAMRVRRVIPMLLPCVAMLALAGWKFGVREPQVRAVRAAHAHLFELDAAVTGLRLVDSEQHAAEVTARASQAAAALLPSVDEAPAYWRQVRDEIHALGWEATIQTYEAAWLEPDGAAEIGFAAARARLTPAKDNPAPFNSLLTVLDRFSAGDRRIDLTRLGVHADEPGRLTAELNLRVACRVSHEKTPE